MNYTQILAPLLTSLGCDKISHGPGRVLSEHLLGTARILHHLNEDFSLVLAGGVHSVYGTSSFRKVATTDRHRLARVIGEEAETLTWGFHRLDRINGWIFLSDEQLVDRVDHRQMLGRFNSHQLIQLRRLEVANLIEQGASL